MKFANLFSVILVAIFSFTMSSSSAHASLQRIGCAEVHGVEVCNDERQPIKQVINLVGCATINDVEVCSSDAGEKFDSDDMSELEFEECVSVDGVDSPVCMYHIKKKEIK